MTESSPPRLPDPTPKKGWADFLRQNLLVGVLFLAPVVLTLWILLAVVRFLDDALYAILPVRFYVPGLGVVVAFLLVLLAGTVARTYFGRFMNTLFDGLFAKVPFIRGFYSGAKQVSNVFFSADADSRFKRVVLVPFPSGQARTLAFVTGVYDAQSSFVFVPTAPNPTSGYVMIFRNAEIQDTEIDVDEAFRVIVSCGFLPLGHAGGNPSPREGA